MKSVKLDVSERTEQGSAACRRMRKTGLIPLNLYGLGRRVRALSTNAHEFGRLLEQGVHIVDLTLGDQTQAALVKDVQWDSIGAGILHADLLRVDRDTPVHVYVPVQFIGQAPEVSGSLVEKILEDIHVECLPLEIPDAFSINLSRLAIGKAVTIGDLEFPANCKPYGHQREDIVVINHVKVEREAVPVVEGELPAEPELIGRKKADEEE